MKSSASSNNLKSAIRDSVSVNGRAVKVLDHCKSLSSPLQLGFSVLLLGLTVIFVYNKTSNISLVSNATSREDTADHASKETITEFMHRRKERCNIYSGEWIPNKLGPSYTSKSCSFIQDHQNCIKNGRPDTDYLYWRWKPHDCELPQFDPKRFLQFMKNRNWAFIGDSISRNHAQSFLCMLSTVEEAVEIYHSSDYKLRRWIFHSYNFTVSTIWSPFLAKAAINEESNGVASDSDIKVNLDVLDEKWTDPFESFDYSIFSGGKWFVRSALYYENGTILGCHYCKKNLTEVGLDNAYRKVINKVFDYIVNSHTSNKRTIFYRSTTPVHFEHGLWYDGGTCNRTRPAKEGEFQLNVLTKMLRRVELEEFQKASATAEERRVDLNLFDVNPLSLLRPDGHPGPYRFFRPFSKGKDSKVVSDCLHWCLPGPIDSWNDLLMHMVVGNG